MWIFTSLHHHDISTNIVTDYKADDKHIIDMKRHENRIIWSLNVCSKRKNFMSVCYAYDKEMKVKNKIPH